MKKIKIKFIYEIIKVCGIDKEQNVLFYHNNNIQSDRKIKRTFYYLRFRL
jgi:hypothetical protein